MLNSFSTPVASNNKKRKEKKYINNKRSFSHAITNILHDILQQIFFSFLNYIYIIACIDI